MPAQPGRQAPQRRGLADPSPCQRRSGTSLGASVGANPGTSLGATRPHSQPTVPSPARTSDHCRHSASNRTGPSPGSSSLVSP
ncbi:hypothetical protein [Nannocystis sp.]|uniref:hypothetical protein n=1 Tax=Nannocystis sp. TaxID=1962667 RepID=UPI0025FAEDC1|nr:hypothetical protein [Nannocystis sp.]